MRLFICFVIYVVFVGDVYDDIFVVGVGWVVMMNFILYVSNVVLFEQVLVDVVSDLLVVNLLIWWVVV